MKQVIHKYPITHNAHGEFTIDMPVHSEILSAGVQRDEGQIWALVWKDDTLKPKKKRFFLALTGMDLPKNFFNEWRLIATLQYGIGGTHVTHLFEPRERQ